MKLDVRGTIQENVDRLNSFLPPDIRVYNIIRCTKSFNAKAKVLAIMNFSCNNILLLYQISVAQGFMNMCFRLMLWHQKMK